MLAFAQASQPGLTTLGPQWNAALSTHHRVAWLARESSKPGREPIEQRLFAKLDAVRAFAQVNPLDRDVVTAPQAEVREAADETSRLVFRAEKDVALELIEVGSGGWAKVRHRDGLAGYVQISRVWGL